jgi:putative membrane protein
MFEAQRKILAAGIALAAVAGSVACKQRADAANREANDNAMVETMPGANRGDWTDAKILRAVVTANAMDSALGDFAAKIASTPGVKDYARTMMRDHSGANKAANDLSRSANIPYDSAHLDKKDPQIETTQDAADQMNELRKLQGIEFDKGYVQGEVKMHEDVLKSIDKDFIPNAQHADLRAYLEKIRPTVAAHLERAKTLKDELDRGAVPAGSR